jgi:hypothetical protein
MLLTKKQIPSLVKEIYLVIHQNYILTPINSTSKISSIRTIVSIVKLLFPFTQEFTVCGVTCNLSAKSFWLIPSLRNWLSMLIAITLDFSRALGLLAFRATRSFHLPESVAVTDSNFFNISSLVCMIIQNLYIPNLLYFQYLTPLKTSLAHPIF